jgi:hypothetical protein
MIIECQAEGLVFKAFREFEEQKPHPNHRRRLLRKRQRQALARKALERGTDGLQQNSSTIVGLALPARTFECHLTIKDD